MLVFRGISFYSFAFQIKLPLKKRFIVFEHYIIVTTSIRSSICQTFIDIFNFLFLSSSAVGREGMVVATLELPSGEAVAQDPEELQVCNTVYTVT